ncbi:MAG: hypothetical protein B7Y50_08805 [Hydrogenophilales bacterium 28-61-11]|nr:MAG: hypothetical protein B7Y50_08805 [Hydrogenophilales bacterium 28-61-11]
MPRLPIPNLSRSALTIAALAMLLGACNHLPGPDEPSLGTLQLHSALIVEPDAASVRLQYGRVVVRNAVQEQDPFCVFEIGSVLPQSQTVQPGVFRIVTVSHSIETIAGIPASASSRLNRRVSYGGDSGPTNIYYKTTFRLRANLTDGPEARTLVCMSDQNAPGNANLMRHLTLAEIRAALGDGFSLNLETSQTRI